MSVDFVRCERRYLRRTEVARIHVALEAVRRNTLLVIRQDRIRDSTHPVWAMDSAPSGVLLSPAHVEGDFQARV